jgi:mono/diheme cytochrome c family protein
LQQIWSILVADVEAKFDWSSKMKRFDLKGLTIAVAFAVLLSVSLPAHAQDAAALFKSKCAGCHGADGTGSAMGKKMGAHDFTSADVQGMTDAQLADTITKGKNKMPKYASLSPDEVKGLVAYIRTLKK